MTVVLSNRVQVFDGFTIFSARAAVMELHDDNRFVLGKLDSTGAYVTDMVFDLPVNQLSVSGSQNSLVLSANGTKKRVDFSNGKSVGIAFGVVGLALDAAQAKKSGINNWVAAFKERGAKTKLRASNVNSTRLIVLVAILVALVTFITVVGALAR
ncbi:MAG: hypothetical protein QOF79_1022 [Actinomycetota bacterium]|nr:hypothetical protein [Actinomycetota bacterium]